MWIVMTQQLSWDDIRETLLYVRDTGCLMDYLEKMNIGVVSYYKLHD